MNDFKSRYIFLWKPTKLYSKKTQKYELKWLCRAKVVMRKINSVHWLGGYRRVWFPTQWDDKDA